MSKNFSKFLKLCNPIICPLNEIDDTINPDKCIYEEENIFLEARLIKIQLKEIKNIVTFKSITSIQQAQQLLLETIENLFISSDGKYKSHSFCPPPAGLSYKFPQFSYSHYICKTYDRHFKNEDDSFSAIAMWCLELLQGSRWIYGDALESFYAVKLCRSCYNLYKYRAENKKDGLCSECKDNIKGLTEADENEIMNIGNDYYKIMAIYNFMCYHLKRNKHLLFSKNKRKELLLLAVNIFSILNFVLERNENELKKYF